MFVRAFLGHRFGAASQFMDDDADDESSDCNNANDCGKCPASGVRKECIVGKCTCVAAFYHTALDPGLAAKESPGKFTIANSSAPLYAEPNWLSIGVSTYLEAGEAADVVTLVGGLAWAAYSFYYVWNLAKRLERMGEL